MICNLVKIIILLGLTNLLHCQDDYWHIRFIQDVLDKGIEISSNQTILNAWNENVRRTDEAMPLDIQFDCGLQTSSPVSNSVHTLRPSDISVVAALGDFVSAGRGMNLKSIFEVINKQSRGEAFSSGGDGSLTAGILTIPNILKKFTSSLVGYGVGFGDENTRTAGFNVASVYGTASNLLEQAESLVNKMKSDTRLDFDLSWKMVTIMTGHNDMCRFCLNEAYFSDAEFIRHVTDTMDYLRRHLPRTIVNLVPAFDYSFIYSLYEDTLLCNDLQSIICPCLDTEENRQKMKEIHTKYYNRLNQLAFNGAYDIAHNFTVVLQPHLVEMDVQGSPLNEEMQKALFGADCFHPSRQGQQNLALMLWNTMLTPVGQKPLDYPVQETLQVKCPTWSRPYIFTNVNSGWIQLPPEETVPTEPVVEEVMSQDSLEKVFILILVGVVGTLVAIIILGIFVSIIRAKTKTVPKPEPQRPEEMEEGGSLLLKNPRLRELMGDGATNPQQLRSSPSGASLARTGSVLSFAGSSYGRSISVTSDDNSDTENIPLGFSAKHLSE